MNAAQTRANAAARGSEETGDAGPACGLGQPLGGDTGARANCKLAQGKGAGEQRIGAQREGKQKREATKYRHRGMFLYV